MKKLSRPKSKLQPTMPYNTKAVAAMAASNAADAMAAGNASQTTPVPITHVFMLCSTTHIMPCLQI